MSKTLIAITALLAAATAAPTFAQQLDDNDAPRVTVSYADLNLTTPAGVATFDQRIRGAVQKVCPFAAVGDLQGATAMRRSRTESQARVARSRAVIIAAAQTNMSSKLARLDH
ncbi:MAG: UrcA family protein [Caulobacteraceae bacterium]